MAQFEVEKREHEVKMRKMEQEMEEVFEMKVQEKLQKLKDIEADVRVDTVCAPTQYDQYMYSSLVPRLPLSFYLLHKLCNTYHHLCEVKHMRLHTSAINCVEHNYYIYEYM